MSEHPKGLDRAIPVSLHCRDHSDLYSMPPQQLTEMKYNKLILWSLWHAGLEEDEGLIQD